MSEVLLKCHLEVKFCRLNQLPGAGTVSVWPTRHAERESALFQKRPGFSLELSGSRLLGRRQGYCALFHLGTGRVCPGWASGFSASSRGLQPSPTELRAESLFVSLSLGSDKKCFHFSALHVQNVWMLSFLPTPARRLAHSLCSQPCLGKGCVAVCWGRCSKAQQKHCFQFWRLEVAEPGVSRLGPREGRASLSPRPPSTACRHLSSSCVSTRLPPLHPSPTCLGVNLLFWQGRPSRCRAHLMTSCTLITSSRTPSPTAVTS